jgi:uncharacterized membrane protein
MESFGDDYDFYTCVYMFTEEIDIAAYIGMIEVFLKMVIYFFHERVWDRINFGRQEYVTDEVIEEK